MIQTDCAQSLALAVVTRAILDLRDPRRHDSAWRWLNSIDGQAWMELAGLDYEDIMRRLRMLYN